MIRIEFEAPVTSTCDCCGGTSTRLTRFVYRDGDAHAVYYARFAEAHPDRYVTAVVSLGEWGEDDAEDQRLAFPLRLWVRDGEYCVTVIDAADSPWRDAAILGRVLDRGEALAHPWIGEVFHITDHILWEDAPITAYLGGTGP